ncbi:hypothetical protein F5Y14DRAFT_202226 [Nemania sp. NC0429]|nr:hypothetical protein F5Y14DRAFT_202226 [Nemania sp. NC0429]
MPLDAPLSPTGQELARLGGRAGLLGSLIAFIVRSSACTVRSTRSLAFLFILRFSLSLVLIFRSSPVPIPTSLCRAYLVTLIYLYRLDTYSSYQSVIHFSFAFFYLALRRTDTLTHTQITFHLVSLPLLLVTTSTRRYREIIPVGKIKKGGTCRHGSPP